MWTLAALWFGSSQATPPLSVPATRPVPRATIPRRPPLPIGSVRTIPRGLILVIPVIPQPTHASARPRVLSDVPAPRRAPALPFVPAEPVRTSIGEPGVLTPVDQLPSAFRPIPEAPNRLPVTRIRPTDTQAGSSAR